MYAERFERIGGPAVFSAVLPEGEAARTWDATEWLMKYLFDIALLVLVLVCALLGKRRGLVRSLLGLVSGIIAAVCAIWLGGIAAQAVYDRFILEPIVTHISDAISLNASGTEIAEAWGTLPKMLQELLTGYGFRPEELEGALAQSGTIVATQAAALIEPVIVGALRIVFSIVFFLLLWLLLRLLVRIIDGACRVPVIRGVNAFLGFLFGLLTGVLLAYLVATWSASIIKLFPGDSFYHESVRQSWVVSLLSEETSTEQPKGSP